jgi:hypothetical protein
MVTPRGMDASMLFSFVSPPAEENSMLSVTAPLEDAAGHSDTEFNFTVLAIPTAVVLVTVHIAPGAIRRSPTLTTVEILAVA